MTGTAGTPGNGRARLRRVLGNAARVTMLAVLAVTASIAAPGDVRVAHAHASLTSSEPAAGANLATGPAVVLLRFNEDVDVLENTRLTGPNGDVAYTTRTRGGLVEILPDDELADGRWDVVWQVVSADGHLVGGVLDFTIGSTDVTVAGGGTARETPQFPGALDRILELLGWVALIVAIGAHVAERRRAGAWAAGASVLVPALRIVDGIDRWGRQAWTIGEIRAAACALLAGGLVLAATTRVRRTAIVGLGVLAWSAQAFLSGHPNAIEPRPAYAALSALHLAGALAWSGAVVGVLLNTGRARQASRLATIGIGVLLPGAALLVAAFLPAAFESGAGRWERILAAKAFLVVLALVIGWRNHRTCRCTSCRRNGCDCPLDETAKTQIRRRARVETGLIALVAVLAATLTTSVPARVADREPANGGPGTSPTTVEPRKSATSGDVAARSTLAFENGESGELLLEIAADGATTIHLTLRDPDGEPFTAEQVEYELENPELAVAGMTGELTASGGMHMGTTVLPGGGTWRIRVNATYDTFTTITATAEIQTPNTTP